MNRKLVSGLAIASLAVVAACGGGGGSHATPAAPLASPTSGGVATGQVTLVIPNATTSSTTRKAQFVSSAAVSATISVNSGPNTIFDLTAGSSNCTGGPSARTCILAITAASGTAVVTVTLFDGPNATGNNLGSATGSKTVTAPTPFALTIDINPAVTHVAGTPSLSFANGLTTIAYKTAETGTLNIAFADAANVTIPSTNGSQFQTPITLASSDTHVTISPTTVNNAAQTISVTYDGLAAVAPTYTITAKLGATTLATLTLKTAGFLYEFATSGAGSQPSGITTGPDGQIWYTEFSGFANNIGRVNFPSPYTASPTTITTSQFPIPTGSAQPFAIAPGPTGDTRVWFTENGATNIGTVDTTAPAPQESSAAGNYHGIVAFSPNMYIVNTNSDQLNRYNSSQIFVGPAASLGVSCSPYGVAVGPDNNLWVTCSSGSTNLYSVDPASMASTPWATNASQTGIAAGPDNAVWFAESTQFIGRQSTTGTHAYTEYPIPSGLALGIAKGPDGAMWFTEPAVNKIGRIDVTTKQIVEFTVTGAGAPAMITGGPDGWLWFTEAGTGLIGRMQPAL